MRPSIERANEQLDPRQQLANTPQPQSTTPGLHPVSIHQMAPPCGHPIAAYYSFIDPETMKGWVGLVGWPAADGFGFTHIVVTRRLQAERRTASVGRPKTDVLPTVLRSIVPSLHSAPASFSLFPAFIYSPFPFYSTLYPSLCSLLNVLLT